MYYLSSCSIVKNEDNYIDDFVKIHKHLGVEFFLFFDRSENPLSERYKGRSDIEVIHFPEPNRHAHAWREGVKYFQGKSRWVQFIDIDQVTVPMKTNDIKVFLQDYEAYGALGLNWHSFGSNGRETEPELGVSTYEAYTKRSLSSAPPGWHPDCIFPSNHIQSIVQVEQAEYKTWNDPHHPILVSGAVQVNEYKKPFNSPWNVPPTQDIGFIAHYYTRSREYWNKKCAKLRADTGTVGSTPDQFEHHLHMNTVEDLTVKNIWDKCNGK